MKFTGKTPLYGNGGIGNKAILFLAKPMVLAFFITFVLFLFFPEVKKFRLEEAERSNSQNAYGSLFSMFADMDGDGETEWLQSGENIRGEHSVILRKANGSNIEQYNFPGKVPERNSRFYLGDANKNGFQEVYLFSTIDDSLFLHCFEPMKENGIYTEKVFVDLIRKKNKMIDYYIFMTGLSDMNHDGYMTFVFSVNSGYSIYPRKTYAFNPLTNDLHQSVSGGWQIGNQLFAKGPDGNQVVLSSVFAPGNFKEGETTPYSDHSAWLFVLNHQMNFLFEPIEFKGYNTAISLMPFSENPEDGFLLHNSTLLDCDTCETLSAYSYSGERRKTVPYNKYHFYRSSIVKPHLFHNERPLIYRYNDGQLTSIDTGLNLKVLKKLPDKLYFTELTVSELDFDKDNQKDFVFIEKAGGFIIITPDLQHHAEVELTGGMMTPASLRRSPDLSEPQLAVQSRDYFVFYNLITNPFYFWRWPALLLIYAFFAGLLYWSRHVYAKQLQRNQAIERELSELQFSAVTNQLDPHFAFNILNTIGGSILNDNKETAYDNLIQFSRLIRHSLEDSDTIGRSIEKETELLHNYLRLQQQSHPESFDYQLSISPKVDVSWQIPKLILQSFAENALKHGLYPANRKGLLTIAISTDKKLITIAIEDNGIGRAQAALQNNNSTRKGTALFNRLSELINRKRKGHFSIQITDLYHPDQSAAGTRVIIQLSAQPIFGFYEN